MWKTGRSKWLVALRRRAADRAIRSHKRYKSPAGDVDLIRLGQ
jgi:hypothetical protein